MKKRKLEEKKQQRAKYRQKQNHNQPGDLCGCVHPAVEQIEHHGRGKEDGTAVKMGKEIGKQQRGSRKAL